VETSSSGDQAVTSPPRLRSSGRAPGPDGRGTACSPESAAGEDGEDGEAPDEPDGGSAGGGSADEDGWSKKNGPVSSARTGGPVGGDAAGPGAGCPCGGVGGDSPGLGSGRLVPGAQAEPFQYRM
jgi:hypothetical protein